MMESNCNQCLESLDYTIAERIACVDRLTKILSGYHEGCFRRMKCRGVSVAGRL
jgi:hypothetical protein